MIFSLTFLKLAFNVNFADRVYAMICKIFWNLKVVSVFSIIDDLYMHMVNDRNF